MSPKTVSITIPAATTAAHAASFWDVFQKIFAILQEVEPIVIHFLPPPVAAGVDIAIAVEPIVVSTVQATN